MTTLPFVDDHRVRVRSGGTDVGRGHEARPPSYRALVIGSGGHGVAVRTMLQTIRRVAERPGS